MRIPSKNTINNINISIEYIYLGYNTIKKGGNHYGNYEHGCYNITNKCNQTT